MARGTCLCLGRVGVDGLAALRIKVGHGTNLYLGTDTFVHPEAWSATYECSENPADRQAVAVASAKRDKVAARLADIRISGHLAKMNRGQLKKYLTEPMASVEDCMKSTELTVGELFERVIATKSEGVIGNFAPSKIGKVKST